jgi:subtilase family serine protease
MRKKHASALIALLALATLAIPVGATADPAAPRGYLQALFFLRHPAGLNRFVAAVSDPTSPRYRQYASVEALVRRFGAPPQDRQAAKRWLAGQGLRGRVGPTEAYVTARIPRGRIDELLPTAGASASGAGLAAARRVPAALRGPVTAVGLLDTRPGAFQPAARALASPLAASSATTPPHGSILPHSGTAAGCEAGRSAGVDPPLLTGFTPNQYLTAYGHAELQDSGLRGQGFRVALIETEGFKRSDIETFGKCFGLRVPPTTSIVTARKRILPPGDETTLDLEMLTATVPDLDRIYVYQGGSSEAGLMRIVAAALGRRGHHPDAISISLGQCEQGLAGQLAFRRGLDNVFAVAAGAGISTLVAAGDTGSSGCTVFGSEGKTALPVLAASDPASSPFVTAVGGTNLALSKGNRIRSQIVWNDSPLEPAGGGGAPSILSDQRPWWQRLRGLDRYGDGRIVPDIAALADLVPGYSYYCTAPECLKEGGPAWTAIGGTSVATPLMAGGVILASQYARERGQRALGFLNPLLYRLGAAKQSRQSVFYDVTEGNNDIGAILPEAAGGGSPLGCCSARQGYDWASGWGSLKIPGLAAAAVTAAR